MESGSEPGSHPRQVRGVLTTRCRGSFVITQSAPRCEGYRQHRVSPTVAVTTLIPSPTPCAWTQALGRRGYGNVVISEDRIPLLTSLRSGKRARFKCVYCASSSPLCKDYCPGEGAANIASLGLRGRGPQCSLE